MKKENILVFPCGSEVALEIFRSVKYSTHFNLIGGSSVDDHGKFIYKNYIGNLPFINDNEFIPAIKEVVSTNNIAAIYPAMDSVITILKKNEKYLGCKIISSDYKTTKICLSKSQTYKTLRGIVPIPTSFRNIKKLQKFPVFLKPDIGYGSKGTKKCNNKSEVYQHLKDYPNSVISEYLCGKEYTVDCFTNYKGELLFIGARERKRIAGGISVNTSTIESEKRFINFAQKINEEIKFNGAWFFQVKEDENGDIFLMEIASRLGGSSGAYRMKGVNFALLSIFNAFKINVDIILNDYAVEMDRALDCKYKIKINFNHVYIDFDDVIISNDKVNTEVISCIFYFINEGKKVYLITKHKNDIHKTLKKYRLNNIFDKIYHLNKQDEKWSYIEHLDAIFIDDSFSERKSVSKNKNIPVFAPENLKLFI